VYDATIGYAGLADSDKTEGAEDGFEEGESEGDGADVATPDPAKRHRERLAVDDHPKLHKQKVVLMEGERELTTGLLSKGASFRLIVSGHIGEKEIDRLIQKLELDKEILAEPDEPESNEDVEG
jgi:hypothetical protein